MRLKKANNALLAMVVSALALSACTQETQNQISRSLNNWTGTDGILEIYSGGKMVRRFLKVDKLSTAYGTSSNEARPYRYGNGVLDLNLNGVADNGEKKVYFEFSEYSTQYIFYESPN